MKTIKNNLIKYILIGDFKNAKTISFDVISEKDFYDLIIGLGFEIESIALYSFIYFLILEEREPAYLHQLAAVLISQALSPINGSYSVGLYHAKRAVEIDSNNITYKEYLLLFNVIPEKLLNDIQARKIAEEILAEDSTNNVALEIINRDYR